MVFFLPFYPLDIAVKSGNRRRRRRRRDKRMKNKKGTPTNNTSPSQRRPRTHRLPLRHVQQQHRPSVRARRHPPGRFRYHVRLVHAQGLALDRLRTPPRLGKRRDLAGRRKRSRECNRRGCFCAWRFRHNDFAELGRWEWWVADEVFQCLAGEPPVSFASV